MFDDGGSDERGEEGEDEQRQWKFCTPIHTAIDGPI